MRNYHNIELSHLGARLYIGYDRAGRKWLVRQWCSRGEFKWRAAPRDQGPILYAPTLEAMSKELEQLC